VLHHVCPDTEYLVRLAEGAVGADAFHVCYGIRQEFDAADAVTVKALELRRHPLQVAAKRHRLDCWWGLTIDERRRFVLVGQIVGHFGWEGEQSGRLSDAEAAAVAAETTERLQAAGIDGLPAWHFQFEPDR
jgi:hypothetical protein